VRLNGACAVTAKRTGYFRIKFFWEQRAAGVAAGRQLLYKYKSTRKRCQGYLRTLSHMWDKQEYRFTQSTKRGYMSGQ
jgi:hypothetical protein